MALKNSQYDQIMREYDRRRCIHMHEYTTRLEKIFAELPQLKALLSDIQSASAAATISRISASPDAERNKQRLISLREQKKKLLADAGLQESDLEPQFTCSVCKDTGYVGHEKCHCFKQASIDLLYEQSHLKHILSEENFQTFCLDYYSKEPSSQLNGNESYYSHMKKIGRACYQYATHFTPGLGNILFTGSTGVGKTFLTNCIAKEVLDRTYSVLSLSATELFDRSSEAFSSEEEDNFVDYLLDCDLLIIDDLGTELSTSYTQTRFFHYLNTRILQKKSTIISTNLNINDLQTVYSERIASRIISNYTIYKLYGDDIRMKKKFAHPSRKA